MEKNLSSTSFLSPSLKAIKIDVLYEGSVLYVHLLDIMGGRFPLSFTITAAGSHGSTIVASEKDLSAHIDLRLPGTAPPPSLHVFIVVAAQGMRGGVALILDDDGHRGWLTLSPLGKALASSASLHRKDSHQPQLQHSAFRAHISSQSSVPVESILPFEECSPFHIASPRAFTASDPSPPTVLHNPTSACGGNTPKTSPRIRSLSESSIKENSPSFPPFFRPLDSNKPVVPSATPSVLTDSTHNYSSSSTQQGLLERKYTLATLKVSALAMDLQHRDAVALRHRHEEELRGK